MSFNFEKTKGSPIRLGVKENWQQFVLLVLINGFVGGMVGLERSVLPVIAEEEFAVAAKTAILSFIIVFGIVKAIANYYAGTLANRFGRKNLLVTGWIVAIPVPLMLMYGSSWIWIIAANVFLGIHQGLAWSSTVVMKIDLVGEKRRGFAMGLNEFAGYIAVAIVAFFTGWIASEYGVRPFPFYLGIALVLAGLLGSLFLIRDTRHHVAEEVRASEVPRLRNVFFDTSWRNRNLSSVTQAGLINNLNDGLMWGIFPLLLVTKNFSIHEIGVVTAIYPGVWGIGQLFTGRMADLFCKKDLLYTGMLIQGIALFFLAVADSMTWYIVLSALLGLGTALVYPTFLATIADYVNPLDRAECIGAILAGVIADLISIEASIVLVAVLTILSAFIIYVRMRCYNEKYIKLWDWMKGKKLKSDLER